MTDKSQIVSSTEVQGGMPVFRGTRVPIQSLFDFLEDGFSVEDFVEQHPTVSRGQVISVLEELRARVLEPA